MTLQVGDRVRLDPRSRFYSLAAPINPTNPTNVGGVVRDVGLSTDIDNLNIRVLWDTGRSNVYNSTDLLLERPTESVAESVTEPVTVEHQMKVAGDILEHLKCIDPHACVAGGAAADWIKGEVARDVDVWLQVPSYLDVDTIHDWLEEEHIFDTSLIRLGGRYNSANPETNVKCVFNAHLEGVKFDVIVMLPEKGDPWQVFREFPYSHAEVMWKSDGSFTTSETYDMCDHFNYVLQNYEPSKEYADKCKLKFEERGLTLFSSPRELFAKINEKLVSEG